MLQNLTTEARNPASERLDSLTALEIVRLMNAEDAGIAAAVGEQAEAIAAAIEAIATRLQRGGRLIYFGAGTSGRLGVLDATECPPTFNSPPEQVVGLIAGGPTALTRAVEGAEDRPELAVADLAAIQLSAADVVVGIATSGRTPYVIGGLNHARQVGALAIGLSCNEASAVAAAAELTIVPVVGPEVLSGSTRLKAGTATKLVLNMLSTGAMVRIGKTYGNLMVDLRATNTKLRDRTQRIVSHLTELTPDAAIELLARCDGELKTAVVMHHRQVTTQEARLLLNEAGGQLRQALQSPPHRDHSPLTTHHSPNLILGIDGGGTGTVALLATKESDSKFRVIGRGEAGPSNPSAIGFPATFAALHQAVAAAFATAALPRQEVEVACLALAGAGRDRERRELEQWAQASGLAQQFRQVHDAEPVLAAGTTEGWGIALIAGTGSLAYGKGRDGQTARAGGWGYLFGDEGSAYQIALAALRAVAQAADGRAPPTTLAPHLLQVLQVSQADELIAAIYGAPRKPAEIAVLAEIVTQTADSADAVAWEIVDQAACELARMVTAVARQLPALAGESTPLALAGGLLLGSPLLRERLLAALQDSGFNASPVALVDEPAHGALRLANLLVLR